jgi:transcriptional regulator with XRE-family HTH domain
MVVKRRITLADEPIKIGEELKKVRKAERKSQEDVAYECGIDRRSMTNLEKDIHLPGLDTFGKYALALDMNPSELLKILEENSNYITALKKDMEDK